MDPGPFGQNNLTIIFVKSANTNTPKSVGKNRVPVNPDAADTDGEYDDAAQHAEEQEQQDPLGRPNLELDPMLLLFFLTLSDMVDFLNLYFKVL
mgnify:CR=1 FL=1